MKTLTELNTGNGLVYARKDGLWVCGTNGGGHLRLSTDKSLAVRYVDNVNTRAFAAQHGINLTPARNRVLHYA